MSMMDLIPVSLRALPRDAAILFFTRFTRLFAYGALSVVLVFYLVSLGLTETQEGGRIEIQEVWGTRPQIEVGGYYLVRGKYVLPPGQRGALYFFATAGGEWGRVGTIMDLQHTILDKEKGEFTLMHGMAGPGYFHLYLASPDRYSQMFANVYFGTGANVWRKKQ